MFDLNEAIGEWRTRLIHQEGYRSSGVDKLEDQLREEVDQLAVGPLTAEEAFWVASHRLGATDRLPREFGEAHPSTVWRYRLFWIAVGLLGYLLVGHVAGVASKACAVGALYAGQLIGPTLRAYGPTRYFAAMFSGHTGQSLAVVNIAVRLLIWGVVVYLAYKVSQHGLQGRLRGLGGGTVGTIIVLAGLVVLLLGVNVVQMFLPAFTVRFVGAQEYGRMAMTMSYASLGLSVFIPVFLAIVIFILRPSRT